VLSADQQPRRLRIAKPRDQKPRPFRTEIRAPRRATLHDRQTPLVDLNLNANLISNMLGNPSAAPPLHPSNVHDRCRGRTNKHELHANTFDNRCGPRADRRVIGRGMGDEEVGPRRSGRHT